MRFDVRGKTPPDKGTDWTRRPIWYEIGDADFPSGWYWPGRFGDMYGPYDSREEAECCGPDDERAASDMGGDTLQAF